MKTPLEQFAARGSRWIFRRPGATLFVVFLLTALSLLGVRRLRLDTDLAALLPKSFESVRDIKRLQDRLGATGFVLIVAKGDDKASLKRFADDVAKRIEPLDTVAFVQHRRTSAFFRDRALYYLEIEDLEEIQDRIDATLRFYKKKANPLLVDLEDSKPPSLDFSHLEEKRSPLKRAVSGTGGEYFMSEDGRLVAVFVRPTKLASDFSFAKAVMRDVRGVLDDMDMSEYGSIEVQLGGRYTKRIEQQASIEGDLQTTSFWAIGLLMLFVAFHFRQISAIPLLLGPLMVGLVWLLGVTGVLFQTLNILTAFVGAILLGMGIDHGIHFLGRYKAERQAGADLETAVTTTFAHTGRGVLLAGLTTAIGFSGLAVSRFRAFQEFGIMAALGLLFVMVAYFVILPALFGLLGRFVKPAASSQSHPIVQIVLKSPRPIFVAITIAFVVLGGLGSRMSFNYDFRSLEGGNIPAYALDVIVDRIVGRNQTPIVVLGDDEKDERAATSAIKSRIETDPEGSGIDFVIAAGDVVPADQDEKQELLETLHDTLENIPQDRLDEDGRARLDELRTMSAALPFGLDDIPIAIREQFKSRGVVLVFPRISLSDGQAVRALAQEVRGLPLENGRTVSAAGGAMIMADILDMVIKETPVVVTLTLLLVFLSMWALLRRWRLAVFCLMPAALTIAGTFGGAALLGVRLNYLNIVILPVLFGMAVDAGVHLVLRGTLTDDATEAHLAETGHAVWGASVTTAMGFGALLLAHHPGLESFGQLALIGLVMMVLSSLVWLTSLIGVLRRASAKKA